MNAQKYVLDLLEKECEQRELALITSFSYSNTGIGYAMRGTEAISRFTFDFQPERISIIFESTDPGLTWSNYQTYDTEARRRGYGADGLWRNRHSFSLDQKEAFDAMLSRWQELLEPKQGELVSDHVDTTSAVVADGCKAVVFAQPIYRF